jgi:hypothetical protein
MRKWIFPALTSILAWSPENKRNFFLCVEDHEIRKDIRASDIHEEIFYYALWIFDRRVGKLDL